MKNNYLSILAKLTNKNIAWAVLAFVCLGLFSCDNEDYDKPTVVERGVTGSLSWEFTGDYVLTIRGNGAIPDYTRDSNAPWYSRKGLIKTIVIGDGVISIGDYAFFDCLNITSITIPNNVISIGQYAFSNCKKLTDINISNSVKSIDQFAFSGCTELVNINIPNGVVSIEETVFIGCHKLTNIDVALDNPAYTSKDGVLFNRDKTELKVYPNNKASYYTIPHSVITIGIWAFASCTNIYSINITHGVTRIGYRAFSGCTNLESLTIPSSVTMIGDEVFAGCTNLASVTILATTPPAIGSTGLWGAYKAILYVPKGCVDMYKATGWAYTFREIKERE